MSIRISEKHGVNPSISVCFFCGGDKNEIILPGRLPNDRQAPMKAVWNKEPCDTCKEHMEQGIMLVSVKEGVDHENPYRTGKVAVIKEEVAKRVFPTLGNSRFAYITDEAWEKIGLPIGGALCQE